MGGQVQLTSGDDVVAVELLAAHFGKQAPALLFAKQHQGLELQ
jgi:hypothetical protein